MNLVNDAISKGAEGIAITVPDQADRAAIATAAAAAERRRSWQPTIRSWTHPARHPVRRLRRHGHGHQGRPEAAQLLTDSGWRPTARPSACCRSRSRTCRSASSAPTPRRPMIAEAGVPADPDLPGRQADGTVDRPSQTARHRCHGPSRRHQLGHRRLQRRERPGRHQRARCRRRPSRPTSSVSASAPTRPAVRGRPVSRPASRPACTSPASTWATRPPHALGTTSSTASHCPPRPSPRRRSSTRARTPRCSAPRRCRPASHTYLLLGRDRAARCGSISVSGPQIGLRRDGCRHASRGSRTRSVGPDAVRNPRDPWPQQGLPERPGPGRRLARCAGRRDPRLHGRERGRQVHPAQDPQRRLPARRRNDEHRWRGAAVLEPTRGATERHPGHLPGARDHPGRRCRRERVRRRAADSGALPRSRPAQQAGGSRPAAIRLRARPARLAHGRPVVPCPAPARRDRPGPAVRGRRCSPSTSPRHR